MDRPEQLIQISTSGRHIGVALYKFYWQEAKQLIDCLMHALLVFGL